MNYAETNPDLKLRIDHAEAVDRMRETEGWKIVEANLRQQLEAYEADNATEAKDWSDYLRKAGKIFGIRLLLVDIEDFGRQGKEAAESIDSMGFDTRP